MNRALLHWMLYAFSAVASLGCGGGAEGGGEAGGGEAGAGQGGAGGASGSVPGSTLTACPPDVEGEEAPHQDIPGGVYSVPVAPELEPYASYPVDDITLCWTGTAVHLGYSLPALLVGKKERVSFEGGWDPTSQTFALSSADGTATCTPSEPEWRCNEVFANIVVDLEEVADEAAGLDPAEVAARLEVAAQFANDPIGILDFPAP